MTRTALLAIAALAIASPAFAQDTSFEFRGETTSNPVDLTGRQCADNGHGTVRCSALGSIMQNVGGVQNVGLTFGYYQGRLNLVIGNFSAFEYNKMLDAFTAKYGQPVLTEGLVRNRAGTSYRKQVATWQFIDGELILESSGTRITSSRFEFVSNVNWPPAVPPTVNF